MCGVVGVYNCNETASLLRRGLHALQNRGRQAAGAVTFDGTTAHSTRFSGTVSEHFTQQVLTTLTGSSGIGHTRYATAPNSHGAANTQPFCFEVHGKPIAFAHNGNFTNVAELEKNELSGTPFITQSDSERFFQLVLTEHKSKSILESIEESLLKMKGVCTGILLTGTELIAIRDSWGTRPLYWGKRGQAYVVASETAALDDVGILDWHEVPAGRLISFSSRGVKEHKLSGTKRRFCSFEWVYFAFPTSEVFGVSVPQIRTAFGAALAQEHPISTDLIVPVPDSSTLCAIGYAGVLGKYPDTSALVRKHDTGRTFIVSGQEKREKAVGEKFSFGPRLARKSLTLIDDSIVRGTTTRKIISGLRERGVAEIHVRIAAPPVTDSCYYGIDTAERGLLLASHMSKDEMCQEIGADTLEFLSMEKFKKVIQKHNVASKDCCFACMDGKYFH